MPSSIWLLEIIESQLIDRVTILSQDVLQLLPVVGPNVGQLSSVSNLNFSNPDAVAKAFMKEYTDEFHVPLVGFGAFAADSGNLIANCPTLLRIWSAGRKLIRILQISTQ